jgi:hypothetical protein
MKEKEIKVIKVEPMKKPCLCTLKNELSELQKAVSIGSDYVGLIEIIELTDDVCLLCNEEGKLINLEPNRRLGNDIICGVFYLTGQTKDGDLASIPESVIPAYMEYFSNNIEKIDPEEVNNCLGFGFEII